MLFLTKDQCMPLYMPYNDGYGTAQTQFVITTVKTNSLFFDLFMLMLVFSRTTGTQLAYVLYRAVS